MAGRVPGGRALTDRRFDGGGAPAAAAITTWPGSCRALISVDTRTPLAGRVTSSQDSSRPTDRIAIASVLMAGLLVGAVVAMRFGFFSPGPASTPGVLAIGAAGQPTHVQVGYQPTTVPSGSSSAPAVSARSTATATSEAAERMRIANTDGQGVVLRDSPREDDRTPRGFMDGTWVTMLEQEGPDWARVRGDNGQEGWVPSRYLSR